MSEQQYLRACSLVVDDTRDGTIDLSSFRVVFKITAADVATPNTAIIRVYNVAPATAAKVRAEFKRVTLKAGYGSTATEIIFAGDIRQAIIGRENATDSFLELVAADGDVAYLRAFVSTTLASGWTPDDVVKACLKAMEPYGVTAGVLPALLAPRGIRATTLHGFARDYLTQLCETFGLTWSVALGRLYMRPVDGAGTAGVIELNGQTGLIGWPQQTIDGILIRCLISSRISAGTTVRVTPRSVQEMQIQTATGFVDLRPGLNPEGDYRVWAVNYSGDTRGQEWFMDLVCTGVGQSEPLSQAFLQLKGVYGS